MNNLSFDLILEKPRPRRTRRRGGYHTPHYGRPGQRGGSARRPIDMGKGRGLTLFSLDSYAVTQRA